MEKQVFKQRAYAEIKKKLINCDYKPGTWLNETALSAELGISRTPIREALALIEQEGFVRIKPKKGIFVSEISLISVKQVFQVRKELEPALIRIAAPRLPPEKLAEFRERFTGKAPPVKNAIWLDAKMHLFIVEHSENRFFIEIMYKVFEENMRIIISSRENQVEIHDARAEHVEILDLLAAGKVEDAVKAMDGHLRHCERAALESFYNSSHADSLLPPSRYQTSLAKMSAG
ncbi:MAG: GntR family transcriptional regulator [Treponemataceae bacterium]|nr:MAG: GntR family transcriptional regulator [Treponemataceae bacterium]